MNEESYMGLSDVDFLSQEVDLTEEEIRRDSLELNWRLMSRCQTLPEDLIEKFSDKVDWKAISKYQMLSENFIRKHWSKVEWKYISKCQSMSISFLKEFNQKIDWEVYSSRKIVVMQQDILIKFSDFIHFDKLYLSLEYPIADDIIIKYRDRFNWNNILKALRLSENCLETCMDKIKNLENLHQYQMYTDKFAYKHRLPVCEMVTVPGLFFDGNMFLISEIYRNNPKHIELLTLKGNVGEVIEEIYDKFGKEARKIVENVLSCYELSLKYFGCK